MSAIFKTRKIQRHLVIQPELPVSKRKRRWLLRRLSLILLMGFVLTWLLFQIGWGSKNKRPAAKLLNRLLNKNYSHLKKPVKTGYASSSTTTKV